MEQGNHDGNRSASKTPQIHHDDSLHRNLPALTESEMLDEPINNEILRGLDGLRSADGDWYGD